MAGLPAVSRPRQRSPKLSGRHTIEWLRLLALVALVVAAAVGLTRCGPDLSPGQDRSATAPTDPFSALADGYDGPPVSIDVVGDRTEALEGACLAFVRDASSSVSSGIDPDGQVNKELAAISEAFGGDGRPEDRVVGIVFADDARASAVVRPGDTAVRSTLLSSPNTDGTSITAGMRAASDALRDCPSGTSREVILVSDGASSNDDIEEGLGLLPDDVSVHLVALDGGGWASIAPAWGQIGARASIVRRLDAGVVALAVNRIMSELTGQSFTTGFDTKGPRT